MGGISGINVQRVGKIWMICNLRNIIRYTYRFIPDKIYVKWIFKRRMGYSLNLKEPKTFSEKLQWMKLYDRRPEYTTTVDKYAVKKYIADLVGEEYIIPTIGVWDKVADIDFDRLPNSFVLKTTHDSGGVYICRDKAQLDITKVEEVLSRSLKHNYYLDGREWPYKDVPRRIIAEEYLEDKATGELRDYKFFCFNGTVKALFVATDRQNRPEVCFDFFDTEYNHLDIVNGHPLADSIPETPKSFEEMKQIASILSKGYPELRVDFYEVNGKPYVGELTLFHHGGWMIFEPESWDRVFGDWIELPKVTKNK